MLADKEKAAENTLCILKGFDAVMRAFPPGRTACALVNRRYISKTYQNRIRFCYAGDNMVTNPALKIKRGLFKTLLK